MARTNLSIDQLAALLKARREEAKGLVKERRTLLKRVAEINKILGPEAPRAVRQEKAAAPKATKAAKPKVKAGKKPVAKKDAQADKDAGTPRVTLASCIQTVLTDAGAALRVNEITEKVATIYPTKSKNLGPAVAVALSKMDGVKRVARGVYGLEQWAGKGAAAVAPGVEVVTPKD